MKRRRVMQRKSIIFICIIIFLFALNSYFCIRVMELENRNREMSNQIDTLKKPQLHLINFVWSDNPYGGDYRMIVASGIVFNSGVFTAHKVGIRIIVYDYKGNKLGEEQYLIANKLGGKSYMSFSNLRVVYRVSEFSPMLRVETELSYGYSEG